jgi:hypothetical protein
MPDAERCTGCRHLSFAGTVGIHIHTSKAPFTKVVKAIFFPSGDHAGLEL